jgi:folate-binding protein YgfZ
LAEVRATPGVVHDAETRLLIVTGDDATAYLHAVTTQDLARLGTGESRYAAVVDDRAHYVADFWAWRLDSSWLLEVERDLAAALAARLARFVIAEDVSIEEPALEGIHIEGGVARAVAAEALSLPLPPEGGVRPLGERLRIEAGRARGGVDVGEDDLLPEAGLQGAISLDKGCFPGQEIVRRIVSRGRLRRRLTGVRFRGTHAGESLVGASLHPVCAPASGHVTSAAAVPDRDETVALAWLAAEFASPGTSLTARGPFGEVAGAVTALPMTPEAAVTEDAIRYPEEAA